MSAALVFDAAAFAVLLAFSALIRRFCFRRDVTPAAGAMGIVMALGIFTAYALPQLPFHAPWLARLLTLELLVVWLYLAGTYLMTALRGEFGMYLEHGLHRFGIGTWVAGSAVLAMLVTQTMPEADPLAVILAAVAFAIYFPYLALFVHGYYQLLKRPLRQKSRGVILLATVASQSVLIAFVTVFHHNIPELWFDVFFTFDTLFLCSGIVLIALHFHTFRTWQLATGWKNTNCIVHGAVSISGLSMVLVGHLPADVLMAVWRITLVLFVVIETIELMRLVQRVQRFGLRQGGLAYNTTQWARDFTFGMFYAFSLSLYQKAMAGSAESVGLGSAVLAFVAEWGPFIVLPVMLLEIAIFLRYRVRWTGQAAA